MKSGYKNMNAADKKRVYILDIIRGILIIYVVYYHFMYDLNDIMGHEIGYLYSEWFSTMRDCMSGSLIFISGISCNFSRNNIKRGARTSLIALLLSTVTAVVMPSQTILFGILHLLGMMMLMYGLGELAANKIRRKKVQKKEASMPVRVVLMSVFLILFFVCRNVYYGWLTFGNFRLYLPDVLYGGSNGFLYIMGFWQRLSSADYYPLIPWGFLFLAGAMIGRIFKSDRLPRFMYMNFCPPLAFIGRHTMIIYLAHQPILLGIFMLAQKLV